MHPAFSVIFFTVASGAGYGLFVLLALAQIFGLSNINGTALLVGGLISLGLISAGLLSSTLHLANPKNAWRSFMRFKTSWLSREAVFAIVFYPLALLYLWGAWWHDGAYNPLVTLVGLTAVVLALATVFSTGMIYACLKTIRQWNTALTPANYLLLGLASGAVVLAFILALVGSDAALIAGLAAALLVIAGISKTIYYFWIDTVTGPTINTATGFTRAKVRLLDVGHTAGTFLTDEFGYKLPALSRQQLRLVVLVLGFVIPLILMLLMAFGLGGAFSSLLAVLSCLAGLGTERWLFFAEARHVVNLYHGAQHT